MTKFTRLVAYGCSYTQGQEIIDEQYVPGAEELKRSQGGRSTIFWQTLLNKYPHLTRDSYNELNKPHAWPRHLADRIGIPWVNRALPGISIYNMIYNTERDLANGNISPTDLVILGVTSPNRLIHIDHLGRDDTLHLGYVNAWPYELRNGYKYFINWCNEPTIRFHFLIALQALLHTARTKLKDQLYFAECDPRAMYLEEYIEPPLDPAVIKTLKSAYLDFYDSGLLISIDNMYFHNQINKTEERILAGGHLDEPAHIAWAEHLYENCQRMGLTS